MLFLMQNPVCVGALLLSPASMLVNSLARESVSITNPFPGCRRLKGSAEAVYSDCWMLGLDRRIHIGTNVRGTSLCVSKKSPVSCVGIRQSS